MAGRGRAERQARRRRRSAAGHVQTAQNCWLRAANYYRHAEFWLAGHDPRRLPTFEQMEACSKKFLRYLPIPGEAVEVPYENGVSLCAYFVRAPFAIARQPVLICMGGLDSIKDEMWFMQAHGALQRGISVLMIDGPGQGGTLRRHNVNTRYDYEVPIGRCIDYLETRSDVDTAASPSAARAWAAIMPHAPPATSAASPPASRTAQFGAFQDLWAGASEDHGLADHIKWVFGAPTMKAALEKAAPFTLEGALENMRCPYLIVHGGFDVLGVAQASRVYEYAKAKGVDVTLRLLSEEETGADHCQHDNPTIGQELMADWLAERFGIDERGLRKLTLG